MRSRKAIWWLLHMIVFAVVLTSLRQSYIEDGERSLWTWIWSGEWNENQSLINHLHYKLPHFVCSNGVWKAWMIFTQNVLLVIVSCIGGKLGAPGDSKAFLNDSVDLSPDHGRRHCSFQDFDPSTVAYRISFSVCRSRFLGQKVSIFQPTKESLFTDRTVKPSSTSASCYATLLDKNLRLSGTPIKTVKYTPKRQYLAGELFKSDFLRKPSIGRHSRKIYFSFISPKQTSKWTYSRKNS